MSQTAAYVLDSTGRLSRYSGQDMRWDPMGGPFNFVTVDHDNTLLATADLKIRTIFRLAGVGGGGDKPPVQWVRIGRGLTSLCGTANFTAALRRGAVVLRHRRQEPSSSNSSLSRPKRDGSFIYPISDLPDKPFPLPPGGAPVPPDPGNTWLFRFHTKDEMWAGYSGNVECTVRWTNNVRGDTQKAVMLPTTKFVRNHDVLASVESSSYTGLRWISLGGEYKAFGRDHWVPDKVQVLSPDRVLYDFLPQDDVPNADGYDDKPPIKPIPIRHRQQLTPTTKPYARVLIWSYISIKSAVGHASLVLSDGTYISWWPSKTGRFELMGYTTDLIADAYLDQTYSDDLYLEHGTPPAHVIRLWGLDEAAAKTWWAGFCVPKESYILKSCNCSSVVYFALRAGGIVPQGLMDKLDGPYGPQAWTPYTVMLLAMALAFAQPGSTHDDLGRWFLFLKLKDEL